MFTHKKCFKAVREDHRFTESQNSRVGRDLCGSSSPTLLLKQGHLQQAAQDLVQARFNDFFSVTFHVLLTQHPPKVKKLTNRSQAFYYKTSCSAGCRWWICGGGSAAAAAWPASPGCLGWACLRGEVLVARALVCNVLWGLPLFLPHSFCSSWLR